jgi:hypothetical protein
MYKITLKCLKFLIYLTSCPSNERIFKLNGRILDINERIFDFNGRI